MTDFLRLEVGPEEDPTDLDADALEVSIRRGLKAAGVTDDFEPATFTAVVKGSTETSPLTNTDTRPGQPVRFYAGTDETTWAQIFTGVLDRGLLEYDPSRKDDATRYRLTLTGTDLVAQLATLPSLGAVSGNLTQRVGAILGPHGVPFTTDDPEPPAESQVALPTDSETVLDQLRLVRDTLHAFIYVDKAGRVRAVADGARPRTRLAADLLATDDYLEDGINYHDITPILDTDAVVNKLTIRTLTPLSGVDPVETTYTDTVSADAWGTKPQTVTVNDGVAETHAGLYLATRVDPELVPQSLSFAVDNHSADYDTHLAAAIAVEIGTSIEVHRDGLPDTTLLVRDITHTITVATDPLTRLRWTVTLGLAVPEVLGTRWDDVPASLTWDTLPDGLTWNAAVNWHPYL